MQLHAPKSGILADRTAIQRTLPKQLYEVQKIECKYWINKGYIKPQLTMDIFSTYVLLNHQIQALSKYLCSLDRPKYGPWAGI